MAAIAKTLIPRNLQEPEPLQPVMLPEIGPQPLPPMPQPEAVMPPIRMPEAPMQPLPQQARAKVVEPSPLDRQIQHDQQKLQKIQFQQENPWGSANNHPGVGGKIAHVLSVAGNIAGDIFAPNVMARIPGTQLNRQVEEGDTSERLSKEQEQQSQQALQGANTAHLNAETPEVAPNAESERGARDVETATRQQALDMGPSLATAYAHRVNQVIQEGGDPSSDVTVQHLHDAIEDLQKSSSTKSFQHVAGTSGGKDMYANYDPNKGVYTDLQGNVLKDFKPKDKSMQGALGQYAPIRLLTSLMQTAYRDNPALLPVLKPLMGKIMAQYGGEGAADVMATIPEGQPQNSAGAPIGLAMPEAPTGATRSRGQFAESVLPSIDDARAEIKKLGPQLGPMAGRYNELATSKIGAYGPEFAGLQTTLHNVATAWMRLHANSDAARQDFVNQLRAVQNPENLDAVLLSIDKQAKDYVAQGKGHGGNTSSAGKTGNDPLGIR